MQSLLILGRQPKIGLSELESLYGPDKIKSISHYAAILDVDPCLVAFDRLGGSVKFTKILSILKTTNWPEIEQFLVTVAPEHSRNIPKGKMHLGISTYGYNLSPKQVLKTAINIKKAIVPTGRSVQVVPNKDNALNSAQVIHHKLLKQNGWELVIVKDNQQSIIAQSIKVQDIESYAKRDQNRPSRDSKIGMLPPKLAQIIINLAAGPLPAEATQSICEIPPDQPIPKKHFQGSLVLDPFCGTGVIIQEAAIMGYDCLGTDINLEMVKYSKNNIAWLRNKNNSPIAPTIQIQLLDGDATNYHWAQQPSFIASETYLGKPLAKNPSIDQINLELNSTQELLKQFLSNINSQIKSGTRLCLAIPAWQYRPGKLIRLEILDSLELIGYNRVSFKNSDPLDLIYYRPNQVVGRELLVITKK